MSKFACPKCKANVQKEVNEAPGCPACGFGRNRDAHAGHSHSNDAKCSVCHESCTTCRGHMICG